MVKNYDMFNRKHKKICKGAIGDKLDKNSLFIIRLSAALFTVLLLVKNAGRTKNTDTMEKDECYRDYTFIWTDKGN